MHNSRRIGSISSIVGFIVGALALSTSACPSRHRWHVHRPPSGAGDTLAVPGAVFAQDGIDSSNNGWGSRPHRLLLVPSRDSVGGSILPWTTPGQWLDFSVEATSTGWFTPVARVLPLFHHRHLLLLLDGADTIGESTIPDGKPGHWRDVALPSIRISEGVHRIRIVFPDGGTAFHLVDFHLASPGKPGAVAAADGYWPLHLSWRPGTGCTRYDLFRKLQEDTAFELVGTPSDTFFVDAPPVARVSGKLLGPRYVVVGRNDSASSAPSDTAVISVHPAGLEALQSIQPTGKRTPQGFLVHWYPVPGAQGYSVDLWNGTMGREGTKVTTDTFYLDPAPPANRAYRVYAVNQYYLWPTFAGWVYAQ